MAVAEASLITSEHAVLVERIELLEASPTLTPEQRRLLRRLREEAALSRLATTVNFRHGLWAGVR
jgi:hypothetical protein